MKNIVLFSIISEFELNVMYFHLEHIKFNLTNQLNIYHNTLNVIYEYMLIVLITNFFTPSYADISYKMI